MAMNLTCKLVFAAWLVVLQMWVTKSTARTLLTDTAMMIERHETWMTQHGRTYEDDTEKARRFEIFKNNVAYIDSVNNAGSRPYKLATNKFADLTDEEFKASSIGYKMGSQQDSFDGSPSPFRYANVTGVPSSVDWRQNGAVTPVKEQGPCGCCWAFSAVAAAEGINQLKTGTLLSLSEQQLLDCNTGGTQQGCNGGLMIRAFDFIINNNGLTSESNYPYQGTQGTCNTNLNSVAKITGYEDVPRNSESALLNAVANQPVTVAIEATYGTDFRFYSSGVFSGPCGTNTDHGVTVVGYGETNDGTKYWLVKNSWGIGWGENGYIRMQRDVGAAEGLCGIAMYASYPTVN